MHHVPDRRLPVAHPRAGPAPALLLQPALAALRARARRRVGRAGGHRRGPGAARAVPRRDRARRSPPTSELLDGLEKRFADVPNATLRRKQARQAARAVLPNATETRIVVTGNYRAWRHFVAMRASEHADVEIRELAIACLRELQRVAGNVFGDFRISTLADGSEVAASPLSARAEPPVAGAPGASRLSVPGRTLGLRGSADRHPVRGPPAPDPGAGDAEAGPHRHRHGQPVRRAAPLRPVGDLPAGDDEEGALQVDRRRAAVVPARRQQRRLAARPRRHHLGRVGLARGRARPGLRRPVAVVAHAGRAADRPDLAPSWTRCAPTPTPAA